MNGFERALPIVLRMEGGYVNDPVDPGGETNLGVTHRVWESWCRDNHIAIKPMTELVEDDVAPLYLARYWEPAHCDVMPWPLSLIHFDCVVNTGVGPGTKQLQRALQVTPDGIIGPDTMLQAGAAGPRECYRYLLERMFFYRQLVRERPAMVKFLTGGWMGRLQALYREVQ